MKKIKKLVTFVVVLLLVGFVGFYFGVKYEGPFRIGPASITADVINAKFSEVSELVTVTYNYTSMGTFSNQLMFKDVMKKYKEIQPHAKFFLMTMPKGDEDKNRDELYDKHAELINEIAEKFSNCFVLDFRKYAPVYDDAFKKAFFTGGHMNVMGYRMTATMVESYIDYIIRNNPDSFNQTGFIGKLHYNAE